MKKFFKTVSYEKALKMGPRKFVEKYLFPAMRREHGNGFGMSVWTSYKEPGTEISLDHVVRKTPACGSVMCIGGTMQAITNTRDEAKLAALLGLPLYSDNNNGNSGYRLFYVWSPYSYGPWKEFARQFRDAKTPAQKEKIAEKVILEAIRVAEETNG